MLKRILVPLDGSPLAEAVLPYVQDLAKISNAGIVLLCMAVNPARNTPNPTRPLPPRL